MTRFSQVLFAAFWIAVIWIGFGLWAVFIYRRNKKTSFWGHHDDEDEIAKRSTRRM